MLPEAEYLLTNLQEYTRFALEILEGHAYTLAPHQKIIIETLERVLSGEIKSLLISVPPGSSKTSLVVWAFGSYLMALNPAAKILHSSYSDALVRSNSGRVKAIIDSADYQALFPWTKIRHDSSSKSNWETTADGTFRAVAVGSAVTGFRAGRLPTPELSAALQGLMILDDLNKPADMSSEVKTEAVNEHWESTLKSRKATNETPVIVIQQRVGARDFTGYLLEQQDEQWHHLFLPVEISENPKEEYLNSGQGGIFIEHNLPPGSLWPDKWTQQEAHALMKHVQYNQNPEAAEGNIFLKEFFPLYQNPPPIKQLAITVDTAQKQSRYSDYTVFLLTAKTFDNQGYILEIVRDKFIITDLLQVFLDFYRRAQIIQRHNDNINIYIEDYNAGTGLIQALELQHIYPKAVTRTAGKYSRALQAMDRISAGVIHLPKDHPLTPITLKELVNFTSDDTHAHDDLVDCILDFVNFELPVTTPGASFSLDI